MADKASYTYLLSKSVIRLRGIRTTSTDRVTKVSTTAVESVAELTHVADQSEPHTTDVDLGGKNSSTVVLRDDRRLASIEASVSGRGPVRLKAIASVGGVILGAALALVNPPAGIAVAAVGASALAQVRSKGGAQGGSDANVEIAWDEQPLEVRVYHEDHPVEAEALVEYRTTLPRLIAAHARASVLSDVAEIKNWTEMLALVRPQAVRVEAHFVEWRLSQVEKSTETMPQVELDIGELPPAALVPTLIDGSANPEEARTYSRWLECARRYRVAVSADPASTGSTPISLPAGAIEIRYRPGVEVQLSTWSVRWVPWASSRDAGGEEVTVAEHWEVTRADSSRARVAPVSTPAASLFLNEDLWRDGKLTVEFNDLGEPTKVGNDSTPQLADALSAVGETAKGALDTGSSIAGALVPGSATAASLERQLAIAKNRKELGPLVSPSPPSASDELKEAVEQAELEARLRLAKLAAISSPGSVVYNL